jgi:signal transduction histidine kinase
MMPSKQINFPENSNSIKNKVADKNIASKSPHHTGLTAHTNKTSDKLVQLRIRELQEKNALLEDKIEQQSKKMTEISVTNSKFISIIAHDLRSPFTSIIGVLDLLKESLNDFSLYDIVKYVNIASNSADKTLTLLDNLLAWTIIQNKEKNFSPVKIDLLELIEDEIDCLSISAKQKLINLEHAIAPGLNVCADLQMVKTIFRNLIGNAIKYTNPGGKILISAAEGDQYVEIAVSDDGIGISAEVQKKLFKMNDSYIRTGTLNEKGTGLGLILCKDFVEMHGGNIGVESESGLGCTFRFSLPHYIQ